MPSSPTGTNTLSLHDALPISASVAMRSSSARTQRAVHTCSLLPVTIGRATRSEEHTSELQSLRHLVCRLLPPGPTLFPYTTLFRSRPALRCAPRRRGRSVPSTPALCSRSRSAGRPDRKSTRLNSSHLGISYAVFSHRDQHSFPTRRSSDLGQRCDALLVGEDAACRPHLLSAPGHDRQGD